MLQVKQLCRPIAVRRIHVRPNVEEPLEWLISAQTNRLRTKMRLGGQLLFPFVSIRLRPALAIASVAAADAAAAAI